MNQLTLCTEFAIELKVVNTVCPHCGQSISHEMRGIALRTTVQGAAPAHRTEYQVHMRCLSMGGNRSSFGRRALWRRSRTLGCGPGRARPSGGRHRRLISTPLGASSAPTHPQKVFMKAALTKLASSVGNLLIGRDASPPTDAQTSATADQLWRELTTRTGQTIFQSSPDVQSAATALGERLRLQIMHGKHGPHTLLAYSEQQRQLADAVRSRAPERLSAVAAAKAHQATVEQKKARLEARKAEIDGHHARVAAECARQRDDAAHRCAAAVGEGDEAAATAAEAELSKIEAEGASHAASARADAPIMRAVLDQLGQCEQELLTAQLEAGELIAAVDDATVECCELEWNAAAALLAVVAVHCKLEHASRGRPWARGGQLTIPLFKRGDDCPGIYADGYGTPALTARSFQEISEAAAEIEPAGPLFTEVRDFMKRLDELEREARTAEESLRSTMTVQERAQSRPASDEHYVGGQVARLRSLNKSRQGA